MGRAVLSEHILNNYAYRLRDQSKEVEEAVLPTRLGILGLISIIFSLSLIQLRQALQRRRHYGPDQQESDLTSPAPQWNARSGLEAGVERQPADHLYTGIGALRQRFTIDAQYASPATFQ